MKIYQIRECSVDWDDYYEHIIKSFISKEKAEEYKVACEKDFEKKVEQHRICTNCPLCDFKEEFPTPKQLLEYCNTATIKDFGILNGKVENCKKYVFLWDTNTRYDIIEVDVEE